MSADIYGGILACCMVVGIAEPNYPQIEVARVGSCMVEEGKTVIGFWDKGRLQCVEVNGPKGRALLQRIMPKQKVQS